MQYDITLRVDITDTRALSRARDLVTYIQEYGLLPAAQKRLSLPDAIRWIYESGTTFPKTDIIDCTMVQATPVGEAAKDATVPGLIPWTR